MPTIQPGRWWRSLRISGSETLYGVASSGVNVVVVGEASGSPRIYTSPVSTIQDDTPPFVFRTAASAGPLNGIVYAPGLSRLFAVGDNGAVDESTNDGASWSTQTITTRDLRRIVHAPTAPTATLVACGVFEIWGRDTGGTWTNRYTDTRTWADIAYGGGGGGWVAVTNQGRMVHSVTAAAASWTFFTTAASSVDFNSVEHNGSYFLAAGTQGAVWRSTSGASGTWVDVSVPGGPELRAVVPLFAADEWAVFDNDGLTWYTTDGGATWVENDNTGRAFAIDATAADGSTMVAAGQIGGVWASYAQTQSDYVRPDSAFPSAGPAYQPNDDMAGDGVSRLVTQLRSGRG